MTQVLSYFLCNCFSIFSPALQWQPEHEERKNGGGEASRGFEFVPTCWLVNWLAIPEKVGPLETRNLLCIHGRLDIDRVGDFKICDVDTVERLVREYGAGEGPRLNQVMRDFARFHRLTDELQYMSCRKDLYCAVLRIRDVYPRSGYIYSSRISDPGSNNSNKRGGERKFFDQHFFWLVFETDREKFEPTRKELK
jgi:hypothetical protein